MRTFLIALLCLGSTVAFADGGHHTLFPSIAFGPSLITVDELCVDGEKLRTLTPARSVCTNWDVTEQGQFCTEYKPVYLQTPIQFTATECTQWVSSDSEHRCISEELVKKAHALSYNVPVYDRDQYASEAGPEAPLFFTSFTIPACK